MTDDDRDLIRALQSAVPPWPPEDRNRDLWPLMRRRLEEEEAPPRFHWFEAALAAALLALFAIFPELVPMLLWHL